MIPLVRFDTFVQSGWWYKKETDFPFPHINIFYFMPTGMGTYRSAVQDISFC